MLVGVCDQLLGTSTPSWRKIATPFSLPISAVRFSHSTMSKGDFLPSVKYRSKNKPVPTAGFFSCVTPVSSDLPFSAVFTVAIYSSTPKAPDAVSPLILHPLHSRCRGRVPGEKTVKRECSAKGSWQMASSPHSSSRASNGDAELILRARFFALNPAWYRPTPNAP